MVVCIALSVFEVIRADGLRPFVLFGVAGANCNYARSEEEMVGPR
jgi:hypothetical protein